MSSATHAFTAQNNFWCFKKVARMFVQTNIHPSIQYLTAKSITPTWLLLMEFVLIPLPKKNMSHKIMEETFKIQIVANIKIVSIVHSTETFAPGPAQNASSKKTKIQLVLFGLHHTFLVRRILWIFAKTKFIILQEWWKSTHWTVSSIFPRTISVPINRKWRQIKHMAWTSIEQMGWDKKTKYLSTYSFLTKNKRLKLRRSQHSYPILPFAETNY